MYVKTESTSKHPMQKIIMDEDGCIRFQPNKIIEYLFETGKLDLNLIAHIPFSDEDRMQIAQQLGYSVSSFGDLSYAKPKVVRKADKLADKLSAKLKGE